MSFKSIKGEPFAIINGKAYITIPGIKLMAVKIRERAAAEGNCLKHSSVLEELARDFGFKNWNTLSAIINSRGVAIEEYKKDFSSITT